ncbi:hypothetical protein D9611_014961 [Ephemerocybe angulata]|uniref:Uncharacterized protein n=1 Tax=Ephemerocybe angulata TaxID=980116 RepID=A0A8H5AQF7_9AGAR|nr:hypothetical protein D9611_014961 [Tulosesus angulatus]
MFSDGDVLAISSRFDTAHQEGLFSTVKGCVVGARCTQAHLVSIAVHPGYEAAPRSIDLYVEQYLYPPTYAAPAAPRNLEHAGSCIRRYPHGAPRLQRNNWAIFTATKAGRGPIDLPVNDLYESYKCEDGVRTVWGNIVVVKTDRMGEVCDMVEKDIGVAELLIYSTTSRHVPAPYVVTSSKGPLAGSRSIHTLSSSPRTRFIRSLPLAGRRSIHTLPNRDPPTGLA